MKTSHLDIKLLYSNQAQKEILISEAFVKIDSLLNSGIISMSLNIPPDNPQDGDKYIVGLKPQQAWSHNNKQITYYYGNHWYFIDPKIGSLVWVNDQKQLYFYDQNQWNKYSAK